MHRCHMSRGFYEFTKKSSGSREVSKINILNKYDEKHLIQFE